MDHVSCIVIGAGAVGLAIAKRLAETGMSVLVLEQSARFGEGVSSRNSEVIHGGIYYPSGSLKEQLCLRGKEALYSYCSERRVPFERTGKLIVAATDAEQSQLEVIMKNAQRNDVPMQWLDRRQMLGLEPELEGYCALESSTTGIIDSHGYMLSLVADIEGNQGQIAYLCRVTSIDRESSNFVVNTEIEGECYQLSCQFLVNAAGLGAQQISNSCTFLETSVPRLHLCAGRYFRFEGKSPFQRLIYPVPDKNTTGLGIHATRDLGGQLKFGPDAVYVDQEDYAIMNEPPVGYVDAIRKYFPKLKVSQLAPGYTGIRPKLSAQGESARDFCIEGPADHNVENYVQLFGIESPGLTASLAIGDYVADFLASP